FLSQEEPKKISEALKDSSWVEAMQEELIQFQIQNVWVLVDCPKGPLGFQDPQFPHKVYKVVKAMYGFHQAPRAWYGTLSKYLLDNGFQRSTIDQTLFIRKHKGEFLRVQVYVDDIIFGSSNPKLCREFEALMHDKFKMSAMGELSLFLDLRSMIGSLMYRIASRPDIMFVVCVCARESLVIMQTIVATSTTEAEYVAAASGCGQVL
ncbi:putative ribonuclease H-like domain-containing protein, partial [Tanacetum coccineum]